MFHFYLNVFNDEATIDEEGIECDGISDAAATAIRGARELVAERILNGRPVHRSHRIEIIDENGQVQRVIQFGDLIDRRA